MASISIEKIHNKSGIKYKARVRVFEDRVKIFEKSKSFSTKSLASEWAKDLTRSIAESGTTANPERHTATIGKLIDLYLKDPYTSRTLGKTKKAVLKKMRTAPIANVLADKLTSTDLVNHCRVRALEDTNPKPQTVYQDISYLRSVVNVAEPMFGFSANTRAHDDAVPALIKYGLIGRSIRRERRPTQQELTDIEAVLFERQNHHAAGIPLVDIFHFSITTCMRLGEVTRIRWEDLDIKNKKIIIRDRKDPRHKIGNHCTIPLLGDSLKIILKQPKLNNEERIFPYNPQSISAAWQRTCKKLKILDLRYHDLRAEGACRLFESGMSIVEVSKITGHKDINILNNIYLRI